MRPGLLALGVILLVLGAIGYFLLPAGVNTQDESVETTTFTHMGTEDENQTNTTDTNTVSDNNNDDTNTVNDGFDDTDNDDFDTVSERSTTTTTTFERENVADNDGVQTVYVYVDEDGDMYSEDGEFLGEGITTADMTTTVSDTYGSSDTTTVSDSGEDSWDTTTVSDGSMNDETATVSDGSANEFETVSDDSTAVGADQQFVNDDSTLTGTETETTAENTAAAAGGSSLLRTLSIWSMVIGAILTLLGLFLPSDRYHRDVRTSGAAGKRVTYERESEEHHRRR